MTFDERVAMPRDGHELICMSLDSGACWCIRCGALWLEPRGGDRIASWESPGQDGHSRSSVTAPRCLPSTGAGAGNPAGDARLMLLALTHGWRCEPVRLHDDIEAWRWTRRGLLGGDAWSVRGAWKDGPIVDDSLRELLLTTLE